MEPKFNVEFLEEATGFLDSLDEKSREKIIYNIYKARVVTDKELFNLHYSQKANKLLYLID